MGTLFVTALELFGVVQFDGELQVFAVKLVQTVLSAGLNLISAQPFVMNAELRENVQNAVTDDFTLRTVFDRNFFQNAIGKYRSVHAPVRIQLEVSDHSAVVTSYRKFGKF